MTTSGDLETLYRQHALAVFRFAYGLSRHRAEAEDIVSETFARVATRVRQVKTATARAYLLTVARNVFLDGRRRTARDARALHEIQATPPNEAPRDETALLQHALAALGDLPEGERAALLLRLDHGLSYEEIAASLNISVAAAKVRVHRARLRMTEARKSKGWDHEV